MSWLPPSLKLVPDPRSRSKCVAQRILNAGTSVFSEEAFAAIPIAKEKGQRCDACLLRAISSSLKKCSGCASCWYCNTECQNLHWKLGHKQICRQFRIYSTSSAHQELQEHERQDALLLSYTITRLALLPQPYTPAIDTQGDVLLSLLPHPYSALTTPPVCAAKPEPPLGLKDTIYSRFGNNNFAIHSHLSCIGHGVFPNASRTFNHSCVPNAATKYILASGKAATMEVVTLRDISPGEEICIPYLDPALFQTRHKILQISYGFACDCPSCIYINAVAIPNVPSDVDDLARVAQELQMFVGVNSLTSDGLPTRQLRDLPNDLRCVLKEDYMAFLSEMFSKSSHEGDYDIALDSGMTLLALYLLVYPSNYPQIGMHLLELTKTTWNKRMSSNLTESQDLVEKEGIGKLLSLARQVIEVYGPEGDAQGPFQEIKTLQDMLSQQ